MKNKVHRIAHTIADKVSSLEGVEAILLGEAADLEAFDPYFAIDLDVYVDGALPDDQARRSLLADVEGFESSTAFTADHFVVEEIPVGVHFQETAGIDSVVHRIINSLWVFHETGTNMFYRINKGEVLYSRGGWLASVRAARAEFPDGFWRHVCVRSFSTAEKALGDLGAAVFRADDLLFQLSAARLLLGAAGFLFALNRQFEPSGRTMYERLRALPTIPEGFAAQLDNFLRPEDGLSKETRRELAEHMVRSLRLLGREELARNHAQ